MAKSISVSSTGMQVIKRLMVNYNTLNRAQIVDFFWDRRYRDIVTIAASAHDASSLLSHVNQHETPGWLGWPHRSHRQWLSQINQQRIQTVVTAIHLMIL